MRHRIGSINTGLGNSAPCLLPNTWSQSEEFNDVAKLMLQEALGLEPIKEFGGLDFNVKLENGEFEVDFGYEPAYQYEELLIYHIENDKSKCKITKGKAEGSYGSDIKICENINYDDNSMSNEFKDLIDKWHNKLVENA